MWNRCDWFISDHFLRSDLQTFRTIIPHIFLSLFFSLVEKEESVLGKLFIFLLRKTWILISVIYTWVLCLVVDNVKWNICSWDMTLSEGTAIHRQHVSALVPCRISSENLSQHPPSWIIFHSYVWVFDSLFTWTLGRKAKIIWLGVKNSLYFCCLQSSDSMHFNKFLTMHEFESEELEERLGWHTLIIGYKGMRRHLLFALPATLILTPFLLQNWIGLIMSRREQLGMIWHVPFRGFKSQIMLELISKFCVTQILSAFFKIQALEDFFHTWTLDICS